MKVFIDSSVLIAAALTSGVARVTLKTVVDIRWKPFVSDYVLEEFDRFVATHQSHSGTTARQIRDFIGRSAAIVAEVQSRHVVPDDQNGLRMPCSLMVDKMTTVPRSKLGERVGRLADEDMVRLGRAIVVFFGLAGS